MKEPKFAPETLEQKRARLQRELEAAQERRIETEACVRDAFKEYKAADREVNAAAQRLRDLEVDFVTDALDGLGRLRLSSPR